MKRFIKHEYADGSTVTSEWFPQVDGEWPYPKSVVAVTFSHNTQNPFFHVTES